MVELNFNDIDRTDEEWRPIDHNVDGYYISSHGRVRSGETIMALNIRPSGYTEITLPNCIDYMKKFKRSKNKSYQVHRLVGIYFLPNFHNKPEVDHIDGCKSNNRLYNLRWATRSQNAFNTKDRTSKLGVRGVYEKQLKDKIVYRVCISINRKLKSMGTFDTIEEARQHRIELEKIHYGNYRHI